jgi:hypothetical protein
VRELVEQGRQSLAVESELGRRVNHGIDRGSLAVGVVDDQVGEPDRRRVPRGPRRVMSLDCGDHAAGHAPTPCQDRPNQGVVDPELTALAPYPRLGGHPSIVELVELPVHLRKHQPPDVVNKRRNRQLVSLAKVRQLSDLIGGMAGRHRVTPEALVPVGPGARRIERIVGIDRGGYLTDTGCAQSLDRPANSATVPVRRGAGAGRAHDGDRQGDVRLRRVGKLVGRRSLALGGTQEALT